jgi:UDP-N-acetylmuramoyl-L-alanyl-D-glutamate--2,6-diaminopimelate ligase
MQLSELITGIPAQLHNMKDVDIESIEFDSQKIRRGSLFIAVKGAKYDGHNYIDDVEKNGAAAVVTQTKIKTELPQVVVQDTRAIMRRLAIRFYGDFDGLTKIGITGTNGKTTTAFIVHSILARAGRNPGLIGTIYYLSRTKRKAGRTTPEILDTLKMFKEFKDDNINSVVMEVSSHALKLKRVEDITFDAAVFINLSQDHLDFHETMSDYKRTKLHLFSLLKPTGYAVYNNDDEVSREIKALPLGHQISFGTTKDSDVQARVIDETLTGLSLEIKYADQSYTVRSPLVGAYNLYNILAAFSTGVSLGIDIESIVHGIEALKTVRGRMERVTDNVFVDFAHTPSAIENILKSMRKYVRGRLILVFGCGGDRDRVKRPKMGAIATQLADLVVITSDNPRSESPTEIIDDIKKGVVKDNYKIIEDRTDAIRFAITAREKNDIVIVAGKGHEEYQIVDDKKLDFDDAEVARKCFTSSC